METVITGLKVYGLVVVMLIALLAVLAVVLVMLMSARAKSLASFQQAQAERRKVQEVVAIGKQACDEAQQSLQQVRALTERLQQAEDLLCQTNVALLKHFVAPQLQFQIAEYLNRREP